MTETDAERHARIVEQTTTVEHGPYRRLEVEENDGRWVFTLAKLALKYQETLEKIRDEYELDVAEPGIFDHVRVNDTELTEFINEVLNVAQGQDPGGDQ